MHVINVRMLAVLLMMMSAGMEVQMNGLRQGPQKLRSPEVSVETNVIIAEIPEEVKRLCAEKMKEELRKVEKKRQKTHLPPRLYGGLNFTHSLSKPLSIGTHIVCTGTPSDYLPHGRFTVNLCTRDPTGRLDIAVHFHVHMLERFVMRSTRFNHNWGVKETRAFRPFPFKMDHPFTIEVLVEEKQTLWAVNGVHYCSYAHRNPSPLNAIRVEMLGIKNPTVHVGKTDVYPTPITPPPKVVEEKKEKKHSEGYKCIFIGNICS